jgi:hypothetical protein
VGENEGGNFSEEIEIFVASFVLSFVDKVCDKARDKEFVRRTQKPQHIVV